MHPAPLKNERNKQRIYPALSIQKLFVVSYVSSITKLRKEICELLLKPLYISLSNCPFFSISCSQTFAPVLYLLLNAFNLRLSGNPKNVMTHTQITTLETNKIITRIHLKRERIYLPIRPP